MEQNQITPDFSQILQNCKSGYILRKNLTKATGGLLHGRTMANLDAAGSIGIQGRIKIGKRKIAYPIHEVIKYLQKLVEV